MSANEVSTSSIAFGCRAQAMSFENVTDALVGNLMPEVGQGADDAVITPAWILAGQLYDQLCNLDGDSRPSRLGNTAAGEISFLGNQLVMPLKQGSRLEDGDDFARELAERFTFFSEHLALGILETPVRWVPVQERAVNAIFFQHEFQFLPQGVIDLARGPRQQLFPRHKVRIVGELPSNKGKFNTGIYHG